MLEEIFAEICVKISFVNSAVKNKYVQRSGNFWNYDYNYWTKVK
jgi:hypothetical protein